MTVANAEKAAAAKVAKRAAALMRLHTCSNVDCNIMRLRPWLPAKVYPMHTPTGQKKDSKVPRRSAVHEGWPYAGIEMLVAGQVTVSEFISPPRVTVAMTERERHISVKGYPHEWLVGGEGTPNNAGLAAYLCHGCMCPSVIALTCTLEEATLPAKVLLSSGPIESRDPRCLRPLGLQFRLPSERSLPLFARLLAREAGFLTGPPQPEAVQKMAAAAMEAAKAAAGDGLPIEAAKEAEEAAMRKAAESVAKVAAAAAARAQQAVDAVPSRLDEFIAAVAPAEEHSTPAEVNGALLQGRLLAHITHPYMTKEVPIAGLVSRWPEQVPSEKLPASALRQSLAPLNTSMRHPPLKLTQEGQGAQGENAALTDNSGSTAMVAAASTAMVAGREGKGDPDRELVFKIVPKERRGEVQKKRAELLGLHADALQMRRQVSLASSPSPSLSTSPSPSLSPSPSPSPSLRVPPSPSPGGRAPAAERVAPRACEAAAAALPPAAARLRAARRATTRPARPSRAQGQRRRQAGALPDALGEGAARRRGGLPRRGAPAHPGGGGPSHRARGGAAHPGGRGRVGGQAAVGRHGAAPPRGQGRRRGRARPRQEGMAAPTERLLHRLWPAAHGHYSRGRGAGVVDDLQAPGWRRLVRPASADGGTEEVRRLEHSLSRAA